MSCTLEIKAEFTDCILIALYIDYNYIYIYMIELYISNNWEFNKSTDPGLLFLDHRKPLNISPGLIFVRIYSFGGLIHGRLIYGGLIYGQDFVLVILTIY